MAQKEILSALLGKRKKEAGRPRVPKEIIELIKRIANDNPMWGVPRIHGEILHKILRNKFVSTQFYI